MKKIIVIISVLFVLPHINYAQLELDYEEDINPYFIGDSVDLVFPILYDFFKYNNDHPASNLQLALIFEDRYVKAHPISDYESAIENAERAKLLFGRAKNLIDDKEVRRNAWFYPNFTSQFKRNGKPEVEFDSVRVVFEQGIIDADSFLTHMPEIHKNFMKTVEQYDLASKNFVRINGEFNSLKDVYLLFDKELEKRFNLVKNSFDSTLYYFDQYKKAAAAYPPFKLNQELSFNTIQTYRLDGLVIQTNFLADNIELWDYTAWVNDVKKVIDIEINQLRKDIDKIETSLDASFEQMENWSLNDSINLDPIEKKSIYKIRKYDLNSPVANVFQYKDDKLDLVNEQKSLAVYDTAKDVSFQVKLYAINRVFQETLSLEKDLQKYNQEIKASNLKKNQEFYQEYYGGIEGFKDYFKSEEADLLKIRGNTASKLKNQILDYQEQPFLQDIPNFRGITFEWQMPKYEYDSLGKNIAFITTSKTNVNDLEYFTGYYLNEDSIPQSFYAAKNKNAVSWYNAVPSAYEVNQSWQKISDINVVGGGDINFLLYERHIDSLDFLNKIIVSNEAGEVKNQIEVETQEKPIELVSLRNSNMQIALYQGEGFGDAVWPNFLTVVKYQADSTDYSIKEIDINGKYNGIFQTERGIIITSSSEDLKSLNVSVFDDDFNSIKKKTFRFESPLDINYYYQVSDESLNLLTKRGDKGHIVLSDELELRYSDIPVVENEVKL
ncbi:hypothetical protein [Marivirga sp.]|uniref:hypothetical protein n=1 Tax=Marivirga sp. TaxID=2018662 RepID=UPI002D80F0E9|nr:hypothetical protein [Marivirga sp.]HET8861366.1 hypothetical protein [Marivirga sp.]